MKVYVSKLPKDYEYTGEVECELAELLTTLSGLPASDFGTKNVPRSEYDCKLGEMPVEIKITGSVDLPVEITKDLELTILSGISVTIAPYILYLVRNSGATSNGSNCVGKLYMVLTTLLHKEVPESFCKFFPGKTPSQSSLTYYVKVPKPSDSCIYLGYMQGHHTPKNPKTPKIPKETIYDTDTFVPSENAASMLKWMHQKYVDGDIS
jgi:hypothetical protein